MIDFDKSYGNLKVIESDFKEFCSRFGEASEADTRVKLIDKILVDVCGWPESNIKRETHSESGYSDYFLDVFGKKHIILEAKKEGQAFLFPPLSVVSNKEKILNSWPEFVTQVRLYKSR
ncbi:MAG: hypothetical protein ABIT05_04685 [Chitinophagaceae bacterium]